MEGSVLGNIIALLFFLLFQLCGAIVSFSFLKTEKTELKLLSASVFGSVMLSWFPVIFSFIFGFTMLSNILAAALALILAVLCFVIKRPSFHMEISFSKPAIIAIASVFFIFSFLVIHSYRIDGESILSSQCTYGDMSMHLGFITSIANQGTFPPEYSIMPGVKLSYPFLSDSISSSLYVFGTSLRFSYILPMLFAGLQVFAGAYLLLKQWLKKISTVITAFVFFFLCGGFGFAYFITEDSADFLSIFTSFYTTPTNYVEKNILWVNVIVDMLVPQRATLFGYAVLFTALYFLYTAVFKKVKRNFIFAGILAAALPMIHTHSFLALGLVSGMWLFCELWSRAGLKTPKLTKGIKVFFLSFIVAALLLQYFLTKYSALDSDYLLYFIIACAIIFLALLVFLLIRSVRLHHADGLLSGWGLMLLIVIVFALPQLLFWTFSQAGGDGFLRGHFGWANEGDNYIWFYIKNIGVVALFAIPAIIFSKGRSLMTASPLALILFICEFVVFQPNNYDNNKLLFIAYFFLCGIVAEYLYGMYTALKSVGGRRILAAGLFFLAVFSASLTMIREVVSSYTLFSSSQLGISEFAENETDVNDTFLTGTRHNNELAALSGRNIVCGSSSYVYFHGLDYKERYEDIAAMYSSPESSEELFKKYSVDYVLVSSYEIKDYGADKELFFKLFPCYYTKDDVYIFRVVY